MRDVKRKAKSAAENKSGGRRQKQMLVLAKAPET
jgi:hypothetical protein